MPISVPRLGLKYWTSTRLVELFAMRNLFLDHSWQHGLDISTEKRDAISRGDISGVIVHPMLVDICELFGYLIASHASSETWLYLQEPTHAEATHAARIFDLLQGRPDVLDPVTTMQVHSLFALYYAEKGNVLAFAQLFDRLGGLVLRNLTALGFDDLALAYTTPQLELDFALYRHPCLTQEARSAFSGMMWLELGRSVVLKLPPILDPLILAKFRQLAATHRTGTEINFIRAKSSLFLFDSWQLAAEAARWGSGPLASTEWSQRYWALAEDIHAHLSIINTPGLDVSFIHRAQVITFRSCIIMALAALAELYAVLAPFAPELRHKHGEVVEEISGITRVFSAQGLSASWAIALRPIFDTNASDKPSGVRSHGPALGIIREAHRRISEATPYVPEV
ncbi:hypothetical protein DFH09DRAFT_1321125 [Mycena vulgaris]|nr:hypothetical protein DFH09DRAFT_1321125 [Mycena vulgaris]